MHELQRTAQGKQVILHQQSELAAAQQQTQQLEAALTALEANRGAALAELGHAHAEAEQMRTRLRAEQAVSKEAIQQHKALSVHMRKTLQDLRNECAQKDQLLHK